MNPSKILSQYKHRYIYCSISLLLAVLLLENMFYIIFLILFLVWIYRNQYDCFVVCILIIVLYICSYNIQEILVSEPKSNEIKIIEVIDSDDGSKALGLVDGQKVIIKTKEDEELNVGDVYNAEYEVSSPSNNTFPNAFNYKKYLMSKRIFYTISNPKLEYVRNEHTIYSLKDSIKEYIEKKIPQSKDYVKTFILADKSDFDDDILNSVNMIGISHLFAVSGFHIALLVLILQRLLGKVIKNDKVVFGMIGSLLVIYMLITSFSPSLVRASLMYILLSINKIYDFTYSALDILSFVFILLLLINPFSHYNIGFVLSFLVTFFILLAQPLIQNKSKVLSLFHIGVLSYFATIPIIVNLNHQINLLTIFFNIPYVIVMTYIILPLNYLTFVFCWLDPITFLLNSFYSNSILFASKFDFLVIKGAFSNQLYIWIYYFILMWIIIRLEQRKSIHKEGLCLIVLLVIVFHSSLFDPTKKVVFFDVKGDSILIKDSYNQCNILIDTGEPDEYHSVANYLSGQNIRKLDYLIVTHQHLDHYGESSYIQKEFKVLKNINNKNVSSYDEKKIACGNIILYIYPNNRIYDNENNNSIVISLMIAGNHYLFTGDIERVREEELLKYLNQTVDVLKVAHHGSNTSTSDEFLKKVSPKKAFIIAHRYNRLDHPSKDIVTKLQLRNIDFFSTSEYGTIEECYMFGYYKIVFHKP